MYNSSSSLRKKKILVLEWKIAFDEIGFHDLYTFYAFSLYTFYADTDDDDDVASGNIKERFNFFKR